MHMSHNKAVKKAEHDNKDGADAVSVSKRLQWLVVER